MKVMRALIVIAIVAASTGSAAALETARSLAESGAPHLALARIEQLQPGDPAAPGWAEWEALRLTLLVELKRNGEALKRAQALPPGMPPPALRRSLLAAARAAVAERQGAVARAHAARLLWQLEPLPEEARAARLLVIDSYFADGLGEAAFRAMLRFEQDYRPLERGTAERFVGQLLDGGMAKEAVNWLANLDDASALKLELRLKAGLADADTVIAQARALLAKSGDTGHWRVLAEAAEKLGNATLRVEALERLLHASHASAPHRRQALAAALWQAYATEAKAAANRGHLLSGEDTAWYDLATRLLGTSPLEARALFAHVARSDAAGETRRSAQLQLVFSLQSSGLGLAALNLYRDAAGDPGALDTQARFLLGAIAESHDYAALAVRLWRGLAAPPGVGDEEWKVRVAAMQWRSGAADAAMDTMRMLSKQAKPLPDPVAGRALALAREMLDRGRADLAQEMLAALLPLAGPGPAREALFALGQAAETAAQHARAADYFLRSALAAQAPDALALQARLAAAMNLARAGFRDDARAQLQWVLKHSKDAGQVETARRELSRL
jgi:hypothetical protein